MTQHIFFTNKRFGILLIHLTMVLATVGSINAAELSGRIRLTGSSTIAPLVLEMAHRFEDLHNNVRIDVESGGSQHGINDLIRKRVDMALVSRALSKEEVAETGLIGNVIAHDGLCLIIHKNNPISQISRPDLLGIYRGEITNWSSIGGLDMPITVISKAGGRATLDVFLTETGLKVTDIKAHVIIGENLQGIKTVSGNEGAIAYLSIGAAVASERAGAPVKRISLGHIEPTDMAVSSGAYQPSRPLLIVNLADVELSPLGRAFLNSARSVAVHDINLMNKVPEITDHLFGFVEFLQRAVYV